jgi:hypothetical protein
MTASSDQEALEQIEHETVAICNRYLEESDLEDMEIVQAVIKGVNRWLDDDVIEFSADELP